LQYKKNLWRKTMADCPTCEYHKQRAKIWRDEAYKLAGHPLPRKETSMTQDEIIEMAIQGHASTRDAIRWAMNQERERLTDAAMKAAEKAVDLAIALERESCAVIADAYATGLERNYSEIIADEIRARGQA